MGNMLGLYGIQNYNVSLKPAPSRMNCNRAQSKMTGLKCIDRTQLMKALNWLFLHCSPKCLAFSSKLQGRPVFSVQCEVLSYIFHRRTLKADSGNRELINGGLFSILTSGGRGLQSVVSLACIIHLFSLWFARPLVKTGVRAFSHPRWTI